jgi:hypothetical protein
MGRMRIQVPSVQFPVLLILFILVCAQESYTTFTITLLPQLEILDGGHVRVMEAFQIVESQLEKAQSQQLSSLPEPPTEPWLSNKDLQVEDNVDTILATEKPFVPLLDLEKQINAMLSEDCSMLLRKGQTAVQKATKT